MTAMIPTNHDAWKKFGAFELFGDHVPMAGFRLVVRVGIATDSLERLIESRAKQSTELDADLAQRTIRAGMAVMSSDAVSFAYATPEEVVALLRPESVQENGASMLVHDHLLSVVAGRLARLVGQEVPVRARLYEFPDMEVVRRAYAVLQDVVEETTPFRTSAWLGAWLRGRGLPFHASMLESLEEQTLLIQTNGIDMDALPSWWWRGLAARSQVGASVEVFDDLRSGEDFASLLAHA